MLEGNDFYPRPPGGGRPQYLFYIQEDFTFLSTPSGWRATGVISTAETPPLQISIHALRVEGDLSFQIPIGSFIPFLSTPSGWRATVRSKLRRGGRKNFYPRPPGGGRPVVPQQFYPIFDISIHALRVEGDDKLCLAVIKAIDFYPRPPGGGRQQKRTKFSSVFAQKGEEFASLRRGKRKICRWRFKKDKFWVLIWCEGSGKSVCALASHCG